MLTAMASTGPSGNVLLRIGPDISFRYLAMRGLDAGWDKECRLLKMAWYMGKGTKGQGKPWERSEQHSLSRKTNSKTCKDQMVL